VRRSNAGEQAPFLSYTTALVESIVAMSFSKRASQNPRNPASFGDRQRALQLQSCVVAQEVFIEQWCQSTGGTNGTPHIDYTVMQERNAALLVAFASIRAYIQETEFRGLPPDNDGDKPIIFPNDSPIYRPILKLEEAKQFLRKESVAVGTFLLMPNREVSMAPRSHFLVAKASPDNQQLLTYEVTPNVRTTGWEVHGLNAQNDLTISFPSFISLMRFLDIDLPRTGYDNGAQRAQYTAAAIALRTREKQQLDKLTRKLGTARFSVGQAPSMGELGEANEFAPLTAVFATTSRLSIPAPGLPPFERSKFGVLLDLHALATISLFCAYFEYKDMQPAIMNATQRLTRVSLSVAVAFERQSTSISK